MKITDKLLNEIIDVEFEGKKVKNPTLMEIKKESLDEIFIGFKNFEITDTLTEGRKYIPLSDGEKEIYIFLIRGSREEEPWERGEEEPTLKEAVCAYFDKLHEGKEYKLYMNKPPYSITEAMRRTIKGEILPKLKRRESE